MAIKICRKTFSCRISCAAVDKVCFPGIKTFGLALSKQFHQTVFRSFGGRELRLLKIGRPQGGEMVLAHNLVFLVFEPLVSRCRFPPVKFSPQNIFISRHSTLAVASRFPSSRPIFILTIYIRFLSLICCNSLYPCCSIPA